jgi:hypothetical protein
MLGLAAGDALGTSVEFTIPGSFAPNDSFEIPCTRRVPHCDEFAGFVVFRAYSNQQVVAYQSGSEFRLPRLHHLLPATSQASPTLDNSGIRPDFPKSIVCFCLYLTPSSNLDDGKKLTPVDLKALRLKPLSLRTGNS